MENLKRQSEAGIKKGRYEQRIFVKKQWNRWIVYKNNNFVTYICNEIQCSIFEYMRNKIRIMKAMYEINTLVGNGKYK